MALRDMRLENLLHKRFKVAKVLNDGLGLVVRDASETSITLVQIIDCGSTQYVDCNVLRRAEQVHVLPGFTFVVIAPDATG
ncbi:hypothetical protein D3C85_1036800 [compost metagenome]